MKMKITEADKSVIKNWYDRADKMDFQELAGFLRHLREDYEHDYGTFVEATAAAMMATLTVMDHQFGLTGFQAGCIGHIMISKLMHIEPPYKIMDYNNLLYPQYQHNFEKVIQNETWEFIKKKAQENLDKQSKITIHPDVIAHWKSIVTDEVPFGFRVEG